MNITLHEIMAKYIARLTLLFTVSDMIEDELNCSFAQFFDLVCYALNQIVKSYDIRQKNNKLSNQIIQQSSLRRSHSSVL
jgi:hypothetical protein